MTRPVPFRSLLAAQVRKTASAAIAMLVAALALFAASAHAATASATFYLGPTGSGTQIGTGGEIVWLAPGALPAGSILKSVSIEVTLEDASGGTWASDLNFKAGGLLQIGSDGGSPDWANGQDGTIGAMVVDIKNAPADFPDTIDLNATGASLKNAFDTATWSGTVTITYDAPQATASNTYFLGTPGNGRLFAPDDFQTWIAQGSLPVGSILRSVGINATLESTDNDNWAAELFVLVDPTPGIPGGDGLLEFGTNYLTYGSTQRSFWANGYADPVSTVSDTKSAGANFSPNIDLNAAALFVVNGYDGGGTGGVWSGTITVTHEIPGPSDIFTMNFASGPAVINQATAQITVTVPYLTDVTALAPTFTMAPGASCDHNSGDPYDFSSPVHYIVTSGGPSKDYTVTVTVAGPPDELNVRTFLGRDDPSDLDPISNLLSATPSATGTTTATIDYHGNFSSLPGSPGPDNFTVLWEGWMDVNKDGQGVYTFGTSSDDGSVIYLDLNNDGDFADPGEMIVNNNNYQGDTQVTGEVDLQMDSVHMVIGFYQGGGGFDMRAAFKKGSGLAFDDLDLMLGSSGYFFPSQPPPPSPQAKIKTFGPGATVGVLSGNAANITWYVPNGTDVSNLAATFTLSDGATCTVGGNPANSGDFFDFTAPLAFTVTSSDLAITNVYTVTVNVIPLETTVIWNVNNGTWDTTSSNWLGDISGLPTVFTQGNNVIFNKTAGGTVTVSPGMEPASTTVSAASGTYVIKGGAIAGSGSFTKSGDGMLVLSAANTYSGRTSVHAGTLQLGIYNTTGIGLTDAGVPGPLGAPTGADATIDLYNEVTLQLGNTNPRVNQATDRPINLAGSGPGTVTINVNDNDTSFTFGEVTASGTGAKTLALFTGYQGNGDRESLIINGPISDSSDNSPTSLQITFATQTQSESYISLAGVNTFTGPISMIQGATDSTGYLTIGGVKTKDGNTPGSGNLNGGNYAGAIALGTSSILYYDSSSDQVLSGAVSGPGALIKDGSGTLTLSGSSSYGGTTTVTAGRMFVNGTKSGAGAVGVSSGATLGGTGSVNGSVTYSAGALARFTQGSPLTFAGTLTLNGNVVHLALPAGLPLGTYTIATYDSIGSTGTFAAVPVIDSGSLIAGATATVSTLNGIVSLVVNTGSAYDTWAGANGLTGANNGRTQDPDGDGVANGLEFYLDGNPLGGEAINVTPALDGGNFHVHFTRRQDATAELDITHETSTTCLDGTWSPIVDDGGVTTTIQVTDNLDGTDDVDIYIVRGTDQQRFVRLRLTIP